MKSSFLKIGIYFIVKNQKKEVAIHSILRNIVTKYYFIMNID